MKFWLGKIVGVTLGLFSGGLFGMIIGFIAGHLFDQFIERNIMLLDQSDSQASGAARESLQAQIQQIFFRTTFRVMGRIAKADGVVSTEEIGAAQQIMDKMGLNDALRQQAIAYFTEGKNPQFDLSQDMAELKQALKHQPSLVQMFLEIQLGIAYSDGTMAQEERQVFAYLCRELGISTLRFELIHSRVKAAMSGAGSWHSSNSQQHGAKQASNLATAYAVLGVSAEVSDKELKKEYRKLMSQHHPDKLVAKGLPPEMMKVAKEKTQQIQDAYDQIQKARKG